ncbi:MAG: hypothetical protein IT359_09675 [Gemmatimonadaceae bacterium]|nr:hypothetical protein [Gemmatimonadaceae bacterium]
MWEAAGVRVNAAVGPHAAVAVLGDDPAATGAVTLGIAKLQARQRRVYILDLLGDGQGLVDADETDAHPGVSDMVHFGVSLKKAARPHGSRPNVWLVAGGAESPLAVDVLTNRWWEVIADQVRRADALLLVAAPAMVPTMGQMVMHLDGIVLVGEAISPNPAAAQLGEVRSETALHTPSGSPSVPSFANRLAKPAIPRWQLPVAALLVLAVGAAVTYSRWRPLLGLGGGDLNSLPAIPAPIAPAALASTPATPPGNEASYSIELLFTNSDHDAIDYVARRGDSLPGTTFNVVSVASDSAPWYRLVTGAFRDSASAAAHLAALRQNGVVTTGAGSVARTPFALLLDSATTDATAQLRVSAFRGRGIPAYALRDSAQVYRVYAGAFSTEFDAQPLKLQLDSLNIQSALVTRVGSTS